MTLNTSRKALRNLSLSLGAGSSRKLSSLAVTVILAHRLSPESFGYLVLAVSLTAVLIGIADGGQRAIGWREAAAARSRQEFAEAVVNATITKLAAAFGVWAFVWIAVKSGLLGVSPVLAELFLLYGAVLVFNDTMVDWPLMAVRRFESLAAWMVVGGLGEVLAVLMFIRSDRDLWVAPMSLTASYAIPWLFAIGPTIGKASGGQIQRAMHLVLTRLRAGLPLSLGATLFRLAAQLNVLLVGIALSATATAHYRVAQAVWVFLLWVSLVTVFPVFDGIAKLAPHGSGSGMMSAPYALAISAAVVMRAFTLLALLGIGVAGTLVGRVFGARYAPSAVVLAIMLLSLPAASASAFLREAAASAKLDHLALKVGLGIVATTGVLLVPAAKIAGITGAAVIVGIGELVGLFIGTVELGKADRLTAAEAKRVRRSFLMCTASCLCQLFIWQSAPELGWIIPAAWAGHLWVTRAEHLSRLRAALWADSAA